MQNVDLFDCEVFKPIRGYEGRYEISNYGRVKSLLGKKDPIIMSPELPRRKGKKDGPDRVTLVDANGNSWHHYIHRLVAQEFVPNPEDKPEVNHKDKNVHNCHAENLEWVTHKENILHSRRSLNAPKHRELKKAVVNIDDGTKFRNSRLAANAYGITEQTVIYSCETKSAMMSHNFRWLEDRPEFDDNLFLDPIRPLRCSKCGSPEGLYAPNGAQNKFCGACGHTLNWLKEPGRKSEV